MSESWLVIETSGRVGQVGLARGEAVVRSARLDPARRHARDLAAAADGLLTAEGIAPRGLTGVMVSIGPGGYTGLRVGVMSAKALAYATGCRLVAVPTFAAITGRVADGFDIVDVIADALQGQVYAQRFARRGDGWVAADELRIEPVGGWAARLGDGTAVTGPGVAVHDAQIPAAVPRVPAELREPTVESLWRAGRPIRPATREELFRMEPLYLRGSSAEEKAKKDGERGV
jgi:tRNA threonylcarbamoyladenosine biosynthesis protein TsaB